jgi:hypothetical protein
MSQPIFSHFFGYIWGVKPLYEYPVKNDLDIFVGFLKKKPRPSAKPLKKKIGKSDFFFVKKK